MCCDEKKTFYTKTFLKEVVISNADRLIELQYALERLLPQLKSIRGEDADATLETIQRCLAVTKLWSSTEAALNNINFALRQRITCSSGFLRRVMKLQWQVSICTLKRRINGCVISNSWKSCVNSKENKRE